MRITSVRLEGVMGKKRNSQACRWTVDVPIWASCSFEVDASDEDEAIAKAWEMIDGGERGEVTWGFTGRSRTATHALRKTPSRADG